MEQIFIFGLQGIWAVARVTQLAPVNESEAIEDVSELLYHE